MLIHQGNLLVLNISQCLLEGSICCSKVIQCSCCIFHSICKWHRKPSTKHQYHLVTNTSPWKHLQGKQAPLCFPTSHDKHTAIFCSTTLMSLCLNICCCLSWAYIQRVCLQAVFSYNPLHVLRNHMISLVFQIPQF